MSPWSPKVGLRSQAASHPRVNLATSSKWAPTRSHSSRGILKCTARERSCSRARKCLGWLNDRCDLKKASGFSPMYPERPLTPALSPDGGEGGGSRRLCRVQGLNLRNLAGEVFSPDHRS